MNDYQKTKRPAPLTTQELTDKIAHLRQVLATEKKSGIHLVEDVADVDRVTPGSKQLAVVTQTTLSVDDAAEILAAVKRRFPRDNGAEMVADGDLEAAVADAGEREPERPVRGHEGRRAL